MPSAQHRHTSASTKEGDLLQSVLTIIDGGDRPALTKALVHHLADLFGCEALFLAPPTNNSSELQASVAVPAEAGENSFFQTGFLKECLYLQTPTSNSSSGIHQHAFPVLIHHHLKGIVLLRGLKLTSRNGCIIENLIRIYAKFIAVIDDSERDTLTGLLNRKVFDAHLKELINSEQFKSPRIVGVERRLEKSGGDYWLGVLDIDHFKKINDNFGHLYGDEVLLLFANLMRSSFRQQDLLIRYGGEEFFVVLSPASEPEAMEIFERFRQQLAEYEFPRVGQVTVSIGVAKIEPHQSPSSLIEKADKTLYYAKEHGRNRVCNYHRLAEQGLISIATDTGEIELF